MRNLLTTAAVILTLGVATPALADGPGSNGFGNNGGYGQNGSSHNGNGHNGNGQHGNKPSPMQTAPAEHSDRFNRDVNAWERNWTPFRMDVRFQRTMTRAKLIRRLEAQGYYRVRNLTPARFGSWRAVASYRGHRVVVRINQFTGRVIAARYI